MNKPLLFLARYSAKNLGVLLMLLLVCIGRVSGQTTISTTANFTNQATVSTVTFNFQNTNSFPVIITRLDGILGDYGAATAQIWYKPGAINSAPGQIATTNGWTQSASVSVDAIANTTTNVTQTLFNNLSLTIPANTTYGIAVSVVSATAGLLRIGDAAATVSVSGGGCNFLSGNNIGYAAVNAIPEAPTLTPKGWIGKITFIPGGACTGTPGVPTISGPASICSTAMFNLTATGYDIGGSFTYQWQSYNTTTSSWQDITGANNPSNYMCTGIGVSAQYRLKTTCNSTSASSTSNTFTVAIGTGLAAGVYTINNSAQSSATNFVSFTAAAAAMSCGISGPVTLNVTAGSGPYNENVTFNNVPGSGAVNRIRINGNGAILQDPIYNANTGIFNMNGTQYMTIDSLTIRNLNITTGIGIYMTDTCRHDSIMRCFIDMRSIEEASPFGSAGISLSDSYYNTGSDNSTSQNSYIGYNYILGTNGSGGPYYGIMDGWYGNYSNLNSQDSGNVIVHNVIENMSYGGIMTDGSNNTLVAYNDIHRTNKNTPTPASFVGILCWSGDDYGNTTANSVSRVSIIGNRIHNPSSTNSVSGFTGIEVEDDWGYLNAANSNNVLIANNAIYNINTATSAYSYGIYYWGGNYNNTTGNQDTVRIYHNTIDLNQNGSSTTNVMGIYYLDDYYNNVADNDNVYLKNNLITMTGTNSGYQYGLYYNDASNVPISTNIKAQRNDVYFGGALTSGNYFCYFDNTGYPTLASFQAIYPAQELGTITADPQYTSETTGDLSPINTLLFGNGVNLQADVPTDILGRPRSTAPTVGAFEVGVDAGVSALAGPLGTFCSSVKMVSVQVHNFGVLPITTTHIGWSLNGVMQPAVNYTGSILPNNSVSVNLGNGLFMPSAPVTIKAWTYAPNGALDVVNTNDTLLITTQSSTSVPVDIGPNDSICTGHTLTLDAGFPGSQYLWDNGTTLEQRTLQYAGTYYVKVTAYDGCIGVDTMQLHLRPLPIVDLGAQKAICEGTTTTLDAGHPGATYAWDDGSTNETRIVDTAGNYEVQVTDAFGCAGVGDVSVIMKDIPTVEGINATHADSGLYTFYPLNPLYVINYTWNFGDSSAEVMGYMVQHAYRHNGIYTVTLSLEGECTGLIIHDVKTVDVFNAPGDSGTGIANTALDGNISIYPNPASNQLRISNKSDAAMNRVVVYNALGQQVINEPANNAKQHQLYTGALANGLYSIKVETDKGMFTQKFEVIR